MNKIKWQIHAETSITQIMLWLIIGKIFGGWAWLIAAIFILGNFVTMIKATGRLGADYFKERKGKQN